MDIAFYFFGSIVLAIQVLSIGFLVRSYRAGQRQAQHQRQESRLANLRLAEKEKQVAALYGLSVQEMFPLHGV